MNVLVSILWVVFNLWTSCFSYYLLLLLNFVFVYIMWKIKSMLSNILNIYCKNIFNNFLITESCRTCTHLFQKLLSSTLAPTPAPAPESRNAPMLHRQEGYLMVTVQIWCPTDWSLNTQWAAQILTNSYIKTKFGLKEKKEKGKTQEWYNKPKSKTRPTLCL